MHGIVDNYNDFYQIVYKKRNIIGMSDMVKRTKIRDQLLEMHNNINKLYVFNIIIYFCSIKKIK